MAGWFGFSPLPPLYFLVVGVMVTIYLVLAELAKVLFYRWVKPDKPVSIALAAPLRRVHRLQTNWWSRGPAPGRA